MFHHSENRHHLILCYSYQSSGCVTDLFASVHTSLPDSTTLSLLLKSVNGEASCRVAEKGRIGGVYYFCPVFSFMVPSPSVERDPPHSSLGVRVGHTHTPHTHMRLLMQMLAKVRALTHSLSISYHSLLSWLCVFLFVVCSFSD